MVPSRLPIGIQNFREIREGGYRYVDKTRYAEALIDQGKHCFLSRPRRFGKSLFVDMLKELFESNDALFEGLYLQDRRDWSACHPVVRFDFSVGDFLEPGNLDKAIATKLGRVERVHGLTASHASNPDRFEEVVGAIHKQHGRRVVVLVDEYDKPILDALDDLHLARANRKRLRMFYGAMKGFDEHLEFSFLTGVSRFSRVSLFSGLNNLLDVTMEPQFSSICGYTEDDLNDVFASEVRDIDRDKAREWYNGYSWGGEERVYNPFDILLLLNFREFKPWWLETGSPSFLVEVMRRRGFLPVDLSRVHASGDLLSAFDVDNMAPEALLFQTGYLTVAETLKGDWGQEYRLDFPNREVQQGLGRLLLEDLCPDFGRRVGWRPEEVYRMAVEADLEGLRARLESVFAGIPHQWHAKSEVAKYEGYFASVVYAYLLGVGLDVRVEDSTSRGRIDLAVVDARNVYLFEFKTVEDQPTGEALRQILDKGYADKYRRLNRPIHLVGAEFSRRRRCLVAFDVERA